MTSRLGTGKSLTFFTVYIQLHLHVLLAFSVIHARFQIKESHSDKCLSCRPPGFRSTESTLIKKKINFSSYIRKFRVEQLLAKSYMRKGFLIYEEMLKFPHI